MGEPSNREQLAFEVVRRVLGADVEHHDTGGRQAAVDGLIHYDTGAPAALEVTVLTDPLAHEVETLLATDDFTWDLPGCAWAWTVAVPPAARVKELRENLPRVARWCEEHQVVDPSARAYLLGLPGAEVWFDWLRRTGVSVHGHPNATTHAGKAMVVPSGNGGAVGDLTAVPEWLSEELRSARSKRKVEKLLASGYEETHLFLIVDDTGAPFAGFYALAFGDGLPEDASDIAGLTCVWLAPRWSQTVLRYDARTGWSRHRPYDNAMTP